MEHFESLVLQSETLTRVRYQLSSARLGVHVVIYTSKIFAVKPWRILGPVTRLDVFLLTGCMVETAVDV